MDRTPEQRSAGYVTPIDELSERRIAKILCGVLQADKIVKNHRFHQADLSVIRNDRVIALCEVKRRNIHSAQYEHAFFAVEKAVHMAMYAKVSRLPILMVWNFKDQIKAFKIGEDWVNPGWTIEMRGRNGSNDPADIEPVMMVPISYMKKVHKYE